MTSKTSSNVAPNGTVAASEAKITDEPQPPVLSLAAYYSSKPIRASTFVANFRKSAKRSFDREDHAEAHRLREETDSNYARTLELAVAGIGAPTGQIKAMVLSWIAEVIRHDIARLIPGTALDEVPAIHVFRSLTGALVAERARESEEQPRGDGTQASRQPVQEPAASVSPPMRGRDPKSVVKARKGRQRRSTNLSLLVLLYLGENRGLSLVEARPHLADVVRRSKTPRSISSADAIAQLAAAKPERLGQLLGIIGLWDGAVDEARREAARSRDVERSARAEAEVLRGQVATMQAEIQQLRAEMSRLEADRQERERQALAERQRLGAIDRERRGRLFRFISETLAQRIAMAEEALQVQPPVVDVALQTVREIERDRKEEGEWLNSLE